MTISFDHLNAVLAANTAAVNSAVVKLSAPAPSDNSTEVQAQVDAVAKALEASTEALQATLNPPPPAV